MASTSTNLIYGLTLKTETGLLDDNWELVSPHAHFGHIYAMDVCTRKPLIATCSSDKTISSIRIWNYEEKTLECVKYFAEGGEP